MRAGKTNVSKEIRPDRECRAVRRVWLNRRDAKIAEVLIRLDRFSMSRKDRLSGAARIVEAGQRLACARRSGLSAVSSVSCFMVDRPSRRRTSAQHDSANAFSEGDGVEVYQQPNAPISQAELAQHACLMHGLKFSDSLRAHHYAFTDEEGNFIRYTQGRAFVPQLQLPFGFKRNLP